MDEVRYTLLTDGAGDRTLMPVLRWLLIEAGVQAAIQGQWADLRRLRNPPRTLSERIVHAVKLFDCDLLFIHRDAEAQEPKLRFQEISDAIALGSNTLSIPPHLPVVPVRMTEAWLLFDEDALRRASGNPNGKIPLQIPPRSQWETIPDPKRVLHAAITEATELSSRRRAQFSPSSAVERIAEHVETFSPLRGIAAFDALETSVRGIVAQQGWA